MEVPYNLKDLYSGFMRIEERKDSQALKDKVVTIMGEFLTPNSQNDLQVEVANYYNILPEEVDEKYKEYMLTRIVAELRSKLKLEDDEAWALVLSSL